MAGRGSDYSATLREPFSYDLEARGIIHLDALGLAIVMNFMLTGLIQLRPNLAQMLDNTVVACGMQ